MKNIFSNSLLKPIKSFNLLGKIKYGLKDFADEVKNKADEKVEKFNKTKKYFTDDMDKEDFQNFFKSKSMPDNVGMFRLINDTDGKYYKVVTGNPVNKDYYGYIIYRNGNDIRIIEHESFGDGKNEDDANKEISKQSVRLWFNEKDENYED